MTAGDNVLSARLHGAWQDRSLDYDARVYLSDDVLEIAYNPTAPTVIRLPVNTVRGAELRDGTLSIHTAEGAVVSLSASEHLDGLRHRLEAAVCVFPAQTLSLRGFGSERSAPGSDHDRWFEALLTARRVSKRVAPSKRSVAPSTLRDSPDTRS
jgi:hypothetical protein